MFPSLTYLIHYLTGLTVPLPIPTFGVVMALSFWGAYWIFTLEFKRKKTTKVIPPIHVSRLMDQLLLCCAVTGFVGALLFAKLEDVHGVFEHPFRWLLSYNGLVYYGGLVFGALTYLYITRKKGISFAVAADIGSPGMMLAYGLGRMGCHLSGDGDWGIVNRMPKPRWMDWAPAWAWSSRYPHNVLHEGIYIPGCTGSYCNELIYPVFPTSLYEAVVCLLLFGLLWALRRRITRPGLLFAVYALLIGAERFAIEFIRVNPLHSFLGLTLSQAQFISILWMLVGLYVFYASTRPLSPTGPRAFHRKREADD